jgi:O-antigen ligase
MPLVSRTMAPLPPTDAYDAYNIRRRRPLEPVINFLRDNATTLLVAAAVFLVAYDNGGFGEPTRDILSIVLWWLVILGIGFGIWPLVRTPLPAFVIGGLLLALALFTLLSTGWASDAAGAYTEFTRAALYLGVFALAVLAANRANAGSWTDGLALGIVAIAVIALVSRLFPDTFPGSTSEIARFLPAATTRLHFPLGYWNGLAIFVALGIPLLLRLAVAGKNAIVRGLALVPLPAMAGVIYLTSSRTGVVAAVVGPIVFFLLSPRRWASAAAIVLAGLGSTLTVWALYDRRELVNGPLDSAAAVSQGKSAALIIAGICVLGGLVYGLASIAMPDDLGLSPVLGWILFVAAVALAVVGIAAAHPVQRIEAFKKPPGAISQTSKVEQHLLSKSGNGRWQLWHAAWTEFKSEPLRGRGAGSYHSWWLQRGSLATFAQDAHSLYLEALGELGIVGFVLLVGTFVAGLAAAAARVWRAELDQRAVLAAATAAFLAYAVAASADWMWELTIVSVVAFACLGLMAGPATAPTPPPRLARPEEEERSARSPLGRYTLGIAVIVGGWLLICATAIPLLAGAKLRDSESAVGRGDATAAVKDALDARTIQPWSARPYLQLALVTEQAGRLRIARSWITKAIDRSKDDWSLWLVKARIETELGEIPAARRSLDRARSLNPRSSIFRVT